MEVNISEYDGIKVRSLKGEPLKRIPKRGFCTVEVPKKDPNNVAVLKDGKPFFDKWLFFVHTLEWEEKEGDGKTRYLKVLRELNREFKDGEDMDIPVWDFKEDRKTAEPDEMRICVATDILDLGTGRLMLSENAAGEKIDLKNAKVRSFRNPACGLVGIVAESSVPENRSGNAAYDRSYGRSVVFFDSKSRELLGSISETVKNTAAYKSSLGLCRLKDGRDILYVRDGTKAEGDILFNLGDKDDMMGLWSSGYDVTPDDNRKDNVLVFCVGIPGGGYRVNLLDLEKMEMAFWDAKPLERLAFHFDRKNGLFSVGVRKRMDPIGSKPYFDWEVYDVKEGTVPLLFEGTGCLAHTADGHPYLITNDELWEGESIRDVLKGSSGTVREKGTEVAFVEGHYVSGWTNTGIGSVTVGGNYFTVEPIGPDGATMNFLRRTSNGSYSPVLPEPVRKDDFDSPACGDLRCELLLSSGKGVPAVHAAQLSEDTYLTLAEGNSLDPIRFFCIRERNGGEDYTELFPEEPGKEFNPYSLKDGDDTPSLHGTWKMEDPLSGCAYFGEDGNQISPWFDFGEGFAPDRSVTLVARYAEEEITRSTHGLTLKNDIPLEFNFMKEDGSLLFDEWAEQALPFKRLGGEEAFYYKSADKNVTDGDAMVTKEGKVIRVEKKMEKKKEKSKPKRGPKL